MGSVFTTVVQLDPVHVVFNVSRRQLDEVQKLQLKGNAPSKVQEFEAAVELTDGRQYEQGGHLDFISLQIDATTDSFQARAVFPNRAGGGVPLALVPGQYVSITVTAGQQPDAVLIPQTALVQSQVGAQVFVVGDADKVDARSVEVDRAYGEYWVIRSGLDGGERAVVDGLQRIRSGMRVSAQPAAVGEGQS